ncbi:MAG: 30S ribosome-binding factor RbfA [Actinobacteria bacterium]|nr:30S ribosome-binding factor RbfA [Actinomycetota bacterium]
MAGHSRMDRVSEEFREVLAEEIPKLKDPRIGFVTVTGVTVSPDLRRATVFYTVLGEESDRRATAAALRSARSRLRSEVGRQVRLRFLPELEFEEDDAVERGSRVEEILERLHREEGGSGDDDG